MTAEQLTAERPTAAALRSFREHHVASFVQLPNPHAEIERWKLFERLVRDDERAVVLEQLARFLGQRGHNHPPPSA